jgi:hypothetical protein
MKFNKELEDYINKYKKYINADKWFSYKKFKKQLKSIIFKYPDIIKNIKNNIYNYDNEECCICLENKNLMKTFCCHNYIHHKCLVHSLTYSNSYCPLCRSIINRTINCNINDNKERFDAEILGLVSNIHLNIINIETYYYNNRVSNKILNEYIKINKKAIIKICKKIDKRLGINIRDYFIKIIENKKIFIELLPSSYSISLPKFLGCFTNILS